MGKEKKYTITVTENPEFCGIGAAGIQFAHGKAETASERAAAWHREHRGYAVEEIGTAASKEAGKAGETVETDASDKAAGTRPEETDTAEKNKDKKQKPKK